MFRFKCGYMRGALDFADRGGKVVRLAVPGGSFRPMVARVILYTTAHKGAQAA
jgi:hypothetical protein